MRFVSALVAGLLFGSGLLLSGMTNPQTVLSFLDVAGAWNPALALTMGGALLVAAPAYAWVRRRGALAGAESHIPTLNRIDAPLVVGATLFGAGWGLAGICPAPGLLLVAGRAWPAVAFVAAMLVGMALGRALLTRWRREHP